MLLTDNRWPPDVAQPDAADLIAAGRIGAAAHQALRREAGLTPKPGLVDRRNSGAHRDMDIHTFMHSADAIGAGFTQFVLAGARHAALPAEHILPMIRPLGLQYEQAMFAATGGVNTHKGGIFALGLLCTAAGRLLGRGTALLADALCTEVAAICSGLVERELGNQNAAQTAGEQLFARYGLTGARGEAASGYATVRQVALPVYRQLKLEGVDEERALLQTLLHLMADGSADSNLVKRGGPEGLAFVRDAARGLLQDGGALHAEGFARLIALDDEMIVRNLSPGGSADLLAVTWFLAGFP